MANMFSGNREKKIPKTFKDCYKTDSVSNDLWHWCEQIEKWGLILFIITIFIGLIFSIGTSIVEKEVIVKEATSWRDAETEIKTVFEFGNFFISLLYIAISAFLEYVIYHIIALLIGALATIVQSTRITANVSLYKYATENNIPIVDDVDSENKEIEEINNNINCNKTIHEQYVAEMEDVFTDSKNAHWHESKLTGTRKLICNYCNKEIAFASDEKYGSESNTRKCCPNCGKIQPASNKECYNCKTIFED